MTLEKVIDSYQQLITSENKKLLKLKKAIFQVGTIRLVIVLAAILLCYLLWGNSLWIVITIALAVILFLVFLKYHNKLFIKKRYCELLIQNAENELKGIDYDFSAFDGAPEKADANHSYSLDLDMFGKRSFFQSVNRSVTSYGKDCLANTLLYPFDKKEDITAQQQAIKELSQNPDLLNHFRAIGQMSETQDLDVGYFSKSFLETKLFSKTFWRFMVYIAPVFYLIAIILSILNILPSSVIGIVWIVFFFASLIPLKDINKKMSLFEKRMETLNTYSQLFQIIENEKFESPLLKEIQAKITKGNPASLAIHKLKSYSSNLDQSSNVLGLLILNPLVLWNVFFSIKIENWVNNHKEDIPAWFEVLAKFDSLISFAIYSYNNPAFNYPEVADTFILEGKELGHPMINRNVCVKNDVTVNRHPFFLVVTGANMAGKSTYLRTIGINLTLACAGAPVCAESLKFFPFRLVTNLRTSDSLNDNESYFFAELKRLKMIIDRLQSGEQLFIILDEILKGTNSEDKQKGSIALMKQLVSLNGNGIIATHDLVLGNLEKEFPEAIKNYRFEAEIKDDHLSFSYKIMEGVAQNMNASFLMKKMGITGL